ncbi:MAG: ABC transporter substrate-binding protein, partial [Holophagae bacterium]|nr:ABC transporter substrate-binding protein [Holophagae bacterium]
WEDILEPQFEQRVSLPVGDFDLFNALLVSIYDRFGDSGVKAMGRSMLSAMHPAEMVKSGTVKNPEKPVVTIMPYFFTRMAERTKTMKAVWPEDGAIVSPIFMLAKKENAQALKPLLAFLKGKEVGEILSHRGLFPSTNPDVVNPLPESAPFNWIGWDWLESHDVAAVIGHATELFQQASSEVSV